MRLESPIGSDHVDGRWFQRIHLWEHQLPVIDTAVIRSVFGKIENYKVPLEHVLSRRHGVNLCRASFAKNKFNKDFRELFPEFLDTSRFYPTHGYFHRIAPPEGAKNCADCGFPDNDAVFACKDFSKFCKRLGGSENHVYDPNSNDTDDLFAGLGLGDHHPYLIPTILAAVAAFTAIGYAIISSLEDSNENTI
mmetsp:Transcript_19160/g.18973  ORF Transcript_19160/g.18973 Transcript_19160/m.18973 type:complete len:193 (-) Transcript_19160:20-598(-)